jgi:hypothetical protein
MPYIAQSDRTGLDGLINELAQKIVEQANIADPSGTNPAAYAGLLNYTCTRLAMQVIKLKFGKMRYWIIATTSGVFHNIADEFYRRMGIPYEDAQIKKSGDVDLYAEFAEAIKAS